MTPIGGHIDLHDLEFNVVQWFPCDKALGTMAYTNEADVLRDAVQLVFRHSLI